MYKIIIHDNKTCQFITNDKKIFNEIKKELSYKQTGVEYTQAFKNGWSGITYLINNKGYFFLGLLTRVKIHLDFLEVKYEIEDKRKQLEVFEPIDLSNKFKEIGFEPRDYQERIVQACLDNRKGIVRAATSAGKTGVIANVVAKLNKPAIIYVIGLDLLKQFHDLFSKLFDEPIGFVGNGVCDIQRITIASIWTIGRSLDQKDIISDIDDEDNSEKYNAGNKPQILKMLSKAKVHIFDESHAIVCETIRSIHDVIDPEHIYGFSGTPFRDDNTDLLVHGILGDQITDVSASELIAKGVVAQPIIKFVSIPAENMQLANYQSVYKNYIAENEIRNSIIINETKKLIDKGYTTLVLFKQIKHGNILFELMKNEGIECALLDGTDSLDDRTKIKSLVTNGEIKVILASTIFDIGLDLPRLSGLVLCGGGKSSIRTLQRVGRVIRKYPGKKVAAIVDFYDQVKFLKKHSMIRYNIYKSEHGFKVIPSKEMIKH